MAAHSTWVNDLILFIEGHSGALPLPLGPLNIQVSLFYGEGGDALVMSGVELSQVLPKEAKFINFFFFFLYSSSFTAKYASLVKSLKTAK